ncbi:Protease 3 [Acetobacteraceae bacterium EV16G]|uniref:Protease 3 n=1 Tax=Sorlinia euscelidii TaxID=3081148 RepID=A0ABU7TYF7_9PROT
MMNFLRLIPHFFLLAFTLNGVWNSQALAVGRFVSGMQAGAAENVLRRTLPNGLTVVIVPNHFAPVVRTQMIYRVGSAMTTDEFPGTAHALEHMMFNGTSEVSRSQLSAISAHLGNFNNASTTDDITQYYFEAPAENLNLLLRIEADRMQHLSLTKSDWQRERGAIEQEVSLNLSKPIARYLVKQNAYLFAGSPYAHDALGTRDSFDKTDTARLRHFYETWYQPNNAILLIVGDVEPKKAFRQVAAHFGKIPSHPLPARPSFHEHDVTARTIQMQSDYASGMFVISFPAPGAADAAYPVMEVLEDTLNSERGDLAALRASGEALYAAASYAPRLKGGVLMVYAAFPQGGDPQPLLKKVRQILENVRLHGIAPSLVAAAKRKSLTDAAAAANSIGGLASNWADALAIDPKATPQTLADAVARVTGADVNALAQKVLKSEKALTGIILPSQHADAPEPAGKVTEKFLPTPEKGTSLPDWANDALSRLKLPKPLPQPEVFHLDNGLTLMVKPEPESRTIQLVGGVKNNPFLQDPPGKEGLLNLTDQLFFYGSSAHDRVKFAEALDDLGADADTGLTFSVTALTDKFDAAFHLMAEVERHPAFRSRDFQTMKQQSIATLPGVIDSPDYRLDRDILKKLNPPKDPSLREATPASVRAITREDVIETYRKVFRPDRTTIVVIGNITSKHALDLIKSAFGNWKNPDSQMALDYPPRPNNEPGEIYVADPGRTQSDVTLVENIDQGIRNPDRYALEFGNEVLGGGFNARLLQKLRVETGLVYSVGSGFSWARNRGAFTISYGADPDKADKARELAAQELNQLCAAPISADTLRTVKASMLRAIPMSRASFSSLASIYLSLKSLGLPLVEEDRKAQAIFDMTPQNVQHAFCAHTATSRLVTAILGPEQNAATPVPDAKRRHADVKGGSKASQ